MSLKPVKKSDQNKSWMQPRRDRRKMIQPEYHLIVTEGTETEPPYFNAMRTIINGLSIASSSKLYFCFASDLTDHHDQHGLHLHPVQIQNADARVLSPGIFHPSWPHA